MYRESKRSRIVKAFLKEEDEKKEQKEERSVSARGESPRSCGTQTLMLCRLDARPGDLRRGPEIHSYTDTSGLTGALWALRKGGEGPTKGGFRSPPHPDISSGWNKEVNVKDKALQF